MAQRWTMKILVASWGLALFTASVGAQEDWSAPQHRQFDFWLGKWDVNLRMIQPDKTWKDSVQAKVEIYSILDGKAILELWDSPTIKGFSLRHYDPATKQWVLYLNWPSKSSSSVGSLRGQFRHGRGEFIARGRRPDGGVSVSRYTFCDITPHSLRWDDAYSRDGGKTWTNNWIMEFSRTAKLAELPVGPTAHTFANGGRCVGAEFDRIAKLAGTWRGQVKVKGELVPATLRAHKVLDGCSVIAFLEYTHSGNAYKSFSLFTYNKSKGQFVELWLDNQRGTHAAVLRGSEDGRVLTLLARGSTHLPKHVWTASEDFHTLRFESRTTTDLTLRATFRRKLTKQDAMFAKAINNVCPRSGKPIVADALTTYRGHVIGFCNAGCRDDFAANVEQRPQDRAFFDKIMSQKK